MTLSLAIAIVSLLVGAIAATGTRALRSFSLHDLEVLARRRQVRTPVPEILRERERVALGVESLLAGAVIAFVVSLAVYLGWNAAEASAEHWRETASFAAVALLLAWALLIWLPWVLVRLWAEPLLLSTWPLWKAISVLLAPSVWTAQLLDALAHRLAGRVREKPTGEAFEEEIRTIVTQGHQEGLLEEEAREMIESVISLGDADVAQIMTPRTDMESMHIGLSWPEVIDFVINSGHTRIPVFDTNRDDVVGILHIKDLLPELAKTGSRPARPLAEVLRKAVFVPETKRVDDLLQEFQQTGNHIAIVLDEYGGVSGLVTIEDVLEEIVGEIVDEYDEALVEDLHIIDEQSCEALGRVPIGEINDVMHVHLPENAEYDTIGGLVFSELGHVPTPGEQVQLDGVRVTVLEATRRRVERVRVELLRRAEQEE